MRNVSDKSCRENRNTHFVFGNISENRAFYVVMWKKYCRAGQTVDEKIIRRMRILCRIPKATDSYPDYVILSCFFQCDRSNANASHCYVIRTSLMSCVVIAVSSPYQYSPCVWTLYVCVRWLVSWLYHRTHVVLWLVDRYYADRVWQSCVRWIRLKKKRTALHCHWAPSQCNPEIHFSFLYKVHTNSLAHTTFYRIDAGGVFFKGKVGRIVKLSTPLYCRG